MTEIQPSIVTVNILMVTLKEEERKGTQNINSFFISFISDFKISSTSSVVSSTTTSDEIYFNQSVSLLIGFSTEDIKKGALILGGELEFDSENKALQSCLGFGEINLEEASDCYSVLYNKNGRTIGNIQYSINIEPCEDFIEIDKVSNEWNLIEQISHFYDLDPLMNTSNL